jgi:MOB kinase activator 1
MFYSHTEQIIELGVEAHVNSAFKHFYLFIREFELVEKADMAPLQHLIDKIEKQVGPKTTADV